MKLNPYECVEEYFILTVVAKSLINFCYKFIRHFHLTLNCRAEINISVYSSVIILHMKISIFHISLIIIMNLLLYKELRIKLNNQPNLTYFVSTASTILMNQTLLKNRKNKKTNKTQ